jgi:hypothetical protein
MSDVVALLRRPFILDDAGETLAPQTEVCIDSEEVLQPFFLCEPPEQVRMFILLFCLSVAVGLVLNHGAAARFYGLLVRSELPPNQRRGLGYTACKAYGIFPIYRLDERVFQWVGWLLVSSLVLACSSQIAPRFFLFASFGLYFLYFGQLFCESKHGGHGALLMPSVIMLLALSGGPQGTPWSLVFVKIFLGLVYFAGALSKLLGAVVFNRVWGGSTMQAYLFDAMWSRPHPWAAVRQLQRFLLTRWWVCSTMAYGGLVFELGFLPLVLLDSPLCTVLAATIALGFHLSIDLLQGLDFRPFWLPVLWVFLPELQAVVTGQVPGPDEAWMAVVARGFEEEPCRVALSTAYLVLQMIATVLFLDLQEGKECLPLTCCPMFGMPRNLFGDEVRGALLTENDLREGGHIDCAYNFYPWAADLPMSSKDMQRIPGKMLFWMSTLHVHKSMKRLCQAEFLDQELLVSANFEVPAQLREKLAELVRFLEEGSPGDWRQAAKVDQLVTLQEECHALFKAARKDTLELTISETEVAGIPFLGHQAAGELGGDDRNVELRAVKTELASTTDICEVSTRASRC